MEIRDYRPQKSFIGGLPVWVKACAVKWWFAGAVFYFVGWGLFIGDQLDLTAALGLILGLVTEILINRALIFFGNSKENYRRFIFCPPSGILSIPANLGYGVLLAFLVSYTYHFINLAAVNLSNSAPGTMFLGAEPLLYGLFFTGYDMLCVCIKNKVKVLMKWNLR